jgi:hypothetical protein
MSAVVSGRQRVEAEVEVKGKAEVEVKGKAEGCCMAWSDQVVRAQDLI